MATTNDLVACLKQIDKESVAMAKHSAISGNFELTKTRRDNASESAREAAIEIRRLKHEAHCLCVELGLADRRADSYYQDATAPAGFGRTTIFTKREPAEVVA